MEGLQNGFNVTMQAFQLFSEVYSFCYTNLKELNIPLPEPNQVLPTIKSITNHVLNVSPSFVQELYKLVSSVVVQSNMMGIFLSLVILYIFYCLLLGTFRWMYRLFYGFVRFSLIVLTISGILYMIHINLYNTSSTNERITRSY
ncbi:uncharacterized protein BX663DRAFT_507023 [Cokeromyces recurvatus]|uniref:uncharacterized protein n=1 Tax=Cokeromyces recurvatus TaxID=90255 RepID=UPI00221E66E3|nr:uncharacterized protein BX663DRAFT_507023 [Cokeromyces recurvatus]KAI7903595.1 hypothetical protein BX663DRAFT_507023 [Cokeromyces recurvatus]